MIRLALILCLMGAPALAGKQEAAALLLRAEQAMAAAGTPKQRLAALGQAAQAQEAALAALRADMRALSERGAAVTGAMSGRERTLRAVLSALERLQRAPRAATLVHPGGPVAAARAGMALATFAPELEDEAARLRLHLSEIRALSARRDVAMAEARASLASLQQMRTEIARLLDNERRTSRLPPAMVERLEAETRALAAGAETLGALSGGLPEGPAAPSSAPLSSRRGALTPPAQGVMKRGFGAASDGIELSVRPYAQVYAPADGVVRFAGPYGDYGELTILEPEPGMLFVFAGMGEARRRVGETVLEGEPIGAMGGPPPRAEEFLIEAANGNEALTRETLYIEIRESGAPVDPALWFAFDSTKR